MSDMSKRLQVFEFSPWTFGVLAGLGVILYLAFDKAILYMVSQWNVEEFSHGWLIPLISGYLVWQRRASLQRLEFRGAWSGLLIVLTGLILNAVGSLSALYVLQHLALLVVIAGLVLAFTGWMGLRLLAVPLGILIFMVPVPNVLLNPLSSQLQLLSSSFGVALIRSVGISVFLDGNVIDLGSYKLEVAEACSGLRYLFPLMTLAFLMACFYRAAFWKRALIFLSSIPITLIMNSLRIAAIGVMVDRWGIGMAEGLLHQVQGWMMFMISTGTLVLEVMLLTRLSGERRPWRELFSLESAPSLPAQLTRRRRILPAPLWAAGAAIAVFSAAALAMPTQDLKVPARDSFTSFPLQLANWSGQRQAMERVYLDALKLDDYVLANYVRERPGADRQQGAGGAVNLYIAWYDSQNAGEATHSPRACLPGGGWRIVDLRQRSLHGLQVGTQPLRVNRALIEDGDQRQLVYYWFQQRGRVVTSEYKVKWYLLVDSLLRHRTDGALVRLIVPIGTGASVEDADRELAGFAATLVPSLTRYVPG
jgi:exosortase D (VPLPA-CTERM-specific)